jgi:hypothetical protein
MPFFYHPDIKSQLFHSQYLSRGVVDIYSFVGNNRTKLPYPNVFVYLPLTYFFFGLVNIILLPFYPSTLLVWLNDWGFYQNNYPDFFKFMLILKLPYLIFDLLITVLLKKLYPSSKAYLYWLFNPFVLYLVYILGNFDVIPAYLTLLCFYLLQKKQSFGAYLSLGLAIAHKAYPLIFLPIFLIKFSKNLKQAIIHSFICLLPFILTVIPFYFKPAFQSSFFGSGLTQKIIETKFFHLPVFPLFYIFILIFFIFRRNTPLEKIVLLVFSAFIASVKFHAQWLIWFLPFITIYLTNKKFYLPLFLSFVLCLIYTFLTNDNYLFWGHLTPIDWQFSLLSSPYHILLYRFHLNPELFRHNLRYLVGLIGIIIAKNEKNYHSF